jgi:uncharacterized protein YkwD
MRCVALVLPVVALASAMPLAAQPLPAEPMLAAHNAVRADVGVPPLSWSPSLAGDAAAWADTLAER